MVRFLGDRDSEWECRPPTGERGGGGEGDEDGLLHLLLFRASFLSPDALLDRLRTLLECGGERERELLLVRLDAVSIFKNSRCQIFNISIFQIEMLQFNVELSSAFINKGAIIKDVHKMSGFFDTPYPQIHETSRFYSIV